MKTERQAEQKENLHLQTVATRLWLRDKVPKSSGFSSSSSSRDLGSFDSHRAVLTASSDWDAFQPGAKARCFLLDASNADGANSQIPNATHNKTDANHSSLELRC